MPPPTALSNQLLEPGGKAMARKLAKVAGAAFGAGAFAIGQSMSEAIPETEPNSPAVGGQTVPSANLFDTFTGHAGDGDVDQFNFEGLQPNTTFEFLVELISDGDQLDAFSTPAGSPLSLHLDAGGIDSDNIIGTVPSSGKVSLTLSALTNDEAYQIALVVGTRASVPVPASVALVAAGLVGVGGGLHIARRQRAA